jgi:hypothetical protein
MIEQVAEQEAEAMMPGMRVCRSIISYQYMHIPMSVDYIFS